MGMRVIKISNALEGNLSDEKDNYGLPIASVILHDNLKKKNYCK